MQRIVRAAATAALALSSIPAAPPAGAQETRFVHAQRFTGAEGFGGAIAVALSPDEENVYVTGFTDHSLVVLQRDPITGALTWLQTVFDGQVTLGSGRFGGEIADGLANAAQAVVSPDGEYVYTAGWGDAAIGIFERLGDGTVQYLDALSDPGLAGVSDLAITGDGDYLFSTSFDADRITAWSRDPGTGALTYLDHFTAPSTDEARALQIAPNGNRVWAVSKAADALVVLDFDPVTGFTLADEVVSPTVLDGAYDLLVTGEGARVYVSAFDGDEVTYLRDFGSGLQFVESFSASELAAPIGLWSDGARLWVSSNEASWILELALDMPTGEMTLAGIGGSIGGAPAGLVGAAGGEHLYATALLGAVGAFRTSPLEPICGVRATPELGEPISAALAPGGDHLYLGTADPAGIGWLLRDPATGATTGTTLFSGPGGDQARVALSPDGAHLYAARRPSQEIEVWEITPTGQPLLIDVVPDSASASTDDIEVMVFHPAGEHLYLGGLPGLLALWEREADGSIDIRQSHNLTEPIADIAVTPDGANVYAVTGAPGALHELSRDPVTGLLTRLAPGSPVTPPYAALEPAPDSEWLYAVRDDEIVVLRRQPSGELAVDRVVTGGPGGEVPELVSPIDLAISPDGRRVWALAGDPLAGAPDALIVFSRDPADGTLSWLETRFASDPEIRGLDGPRRLAVSTDGATLTVFSSGFLQPDPSLAVFRSTRVIFADGFESGDTGNWSGEAP